MNLSRPASHRTCLRQTVIIMNGFNLKRYTNWPGPLNQYNLRGILHWVRQHRTAREEKLVGELSLPPYPLVEYKDALLWCTQSPRAKQTVSDSERVSHTLPLHICGVSCGIPVDKRDGRPWFSYATMTRSCSFSQQH